MGCSGNQFWLPRVPCTLKLKELSFLWEWFLNWLHKMEEKIKLSADDIQAIEYSFQTFFNRYSDILSMSWENEMDEHITVKHSALLGLRQELGVLGVSKDVLAFFDHWLQSVIARSARSLLGPIGDDAQQLAKRTGRKVQFELIGADVKIYSDSEKNLIKNMVHLVRNAILHGIEKDRLAVHKAVKGQVALIFKALPNQLQIICRDDGKGIDRAQLVKLTVEKGLATAENIGQKSVSELMEILSSEGFSTSNEIDLYAGRGVGVAAVYAAVKACEGRLEIQSIADQGTEFIITIPRDDEPLRTNLKAV